MRPVSGPEGPIAIGILRPIVRRRLITAIAVNGPKVIDGARPFYSSSTSKRGGGLDTFVDFPPSLRRLRPRNLQRRNVRSGCAGIVNGPTSLDSVLPVSLRLHRVSLGRPVSVKASWQIEHPNVLEP